MSEAKIRIGNQITGTAWLVHPQHAITAAHCVSACDTTVELLFEDLATGAYDVLVTATVIVRNVIHDGALLKLAVPRAETPVLPVIRSAPNLRPQWHARGFPAVAANSVHLFEASGTVGIRTALAQPNSPPVIQLNLSHASSVPEVKVDRMTGENVHALAGMSGSAVRIDGGQAGGHVIGIIRCSFAAMPQDVIYATPIETLWMEFAPHLGNPPLPEWDRQSGFIRPDSANPAQVISSIDLDLVRLAWDRNHIADIYVDYTWDNAFEFRTAVLRLVLHQPQIFRLHVRGHDLWHHQLLKAAGQWMVVESFPLDLLPNQCVELSSSLVESGARFASKADAGRAIHEACDRWVIEKLNDRLGLLFVASQPRDYSPQFDIAQDVLRLMESTWRNWHSQLTSDAMLLHHFLALLLTEHGNYDAVTNTCPGAGPLTFMDCIVRGVTFGLAVAPFLPTALLPKHPQPGNIGAGVTNGHVCGIRGIRSMKLERALRNHSWNTHVVILRELEQLPEQWSISTSNLMSRSGPRRPALDQVAPTTLVIPCDEDLCIAIATSSDAIRAILARRHTELLEAQDAYADSSTP